MLAVTGAADVGDAVDAVVDEEDTDPLVVVEVDEDVEDVELDVSGAAPAAVAAVVVAAAVVAGTTTVLSGTAATHVTVGWSR